MCSICSRRFAVSSSGAAIRALGVAGDRRGEQFSDLAPLRRQEMRDAAQRRMLGVLQETSHRVPFGSRIYSDLQAMLRLRRGGRRPASPVIFETNRAGVLAASAQTKSREQPDDRSPANSWIKRKRLARSR